MAGICSPVSHSVSASGGRVMSSEADRPNLPQSDTPRRPGIARQAVILAAAGVAVQGPAGGGCGKSFRHVWKRPRATDCLQPARIAVRYPCSWQASVFGRGIVRLKRSMHWAAPPPPRSTRAPTSFRSATRTTSAGTQRLAATVKMRQVVGWTSVRQEQDHNPSDKQGKRRAKAHPTDEEKASGRS